MKLSRFFFNLHLENESQNEKAESRERILFSLKEDKTIDYPKFFYPKLAALTKTLLPKMETVYYIHNFKGQKGGVLFRFVL